MLFGECFQHYEELAGLSFWPTNSMIYGELWTVVLRAAVVGNNRQQGKSKESREVVGLSGKQNEKAGEKVDRVSLW